MLVLTRKTNESIVIDHNIVIKFREITTNKVRLIIDAPRNIVVNRGEVEIANALAELKSKGTESNGRAS